MQGKKTKHPNLKTIMQNDNCPPNCPLCAEEKLLVEEVSQTPEENEIEDNQIEDEDGIK